MQLDNGMCGFTFMGLGILTLLLPAVFFIAPIGFFLVSLIYFIEAFRQELKREKRDNEK